MSRAMLRATVICMLPVLGCGLQGYTQQLSSTEIVGGRGGREFSDSAGQAGSRILEVRVWAGDHVDSVQMVYALPDGRSSMSPRRGGSGGRLNAFRVDPGEYVIGLSGRYGSYIDSVRIHTNRRTSALFGGRGGDRDFQIGVPAGNQAVGFAGRAGDYVDALGLVFTPIRQVQSGQTTIAGGRGGSEFADMEIPSGARLAEVRVRAGDRVDAVQAVYSLRDGRLLEGARHGGRGGRVDVFRLDPDEFVVGISGRYGDLIDSMRIHTNKRTSQTFGGRGGGNEFRIDVPSGNGAVGFAGRAGEYVDAIGLTYTRIDTPSRAAPRRPWTRPYDRP